MAVIRKKKLNGIGVWSGRRTTFVAFSNSFRCCHADNSFNTVNWRVAVERRLLTGRDVDGFERDGVERRASRFEKLLREDGGEQVWVDCKVRHLCVG